MTAQSGAIDKAVNRIATFRFYAGLNDFLPPPCKRHPFAIGVSGRASVRKIIEFAGIPCDQVALILVNSNPARFAYIVQPGDYVSVYPEFQSIDISLLRHM